MRAPEGDAAGAVMTGNRFGERAERRIFERKTNAVKGIVSGLLSGLRRSAGADALG